MEYSLWASQFVNSANCTSSSNNAHDRSAEKVRVEVGIRVSQERRFASHLTQRNRRMSPVNRGIRSVCQVSFQIWSSCAIQARDERELGGVGSSTHFCIYKGAFIKHRWRIVRHQLLWTSVCQRCFDVPAAFSDFTWSFDKRLCIDSSILETRTHVSGSLDAAKRWILIFENVTKLRETSDTKREITASNEYTCLPNCAKHTQQRLLILLPSPK